MYHSLETRIRLLITFLPPKESLTLFQIWIFCYIFNYFVPFGVIENRFTKITSSVLMEIVTIPVVLVDELSYL